MLKRNSEEVDAAAKQGLITQAEADRIKESNAQRIAAMQEELQGSLTAKQRSDLEAQLALIEAAQQAELQQFNTTLQSGGAIKDLVDQINKLMMDSGLGILDDPALAALAGQIERLQKAGTTGPIALPGYIPPASPGQYNNSGGNTYQTSSQSTYNMPIYTSNGPDALQRSLAVVRASAMR
jgi:hypothetical protein